MHDGGNEQDRNHGDQAIAWACHNLWEDGRGEGGCSWGGKKGGREEVTVEKGGSAGLTHSAQVTIDVSKQPLMDRVVPLPVV